MLLEDFGTIRFLEGTLLSQRRMVHVKLEWLSKGCRVCPLCGQFLLPELIPKRWHQSKIELLKSALNLLFLLARHRIVKHDSFMV